MTKPTVKIVLDPQSKSERRKIKLRVTFDRKSRLFLTTSDEMLTWDEFRNQKMKKTKIALSKAETCKEIAKNIIDELGPNFSFIKFKEKYGSKALNHCGTLIEPKQKYDIASLYHEYFESKNSIDGVTSLAISTIESYSSGLNWILSFKPDCTIFDINADFLNRLQQYIIKTRRDSQLEKAKQTAAILKIPVPSNVITKEISANTIGMYFRGIRAVCNYARNKGIITETPFKDYTFSSVPRQKRSLDKSELSKIFSFSTDNPRIAFAIDFFKLSFLLSGMNLGDIFMLKKGDFSGCHLKIFRQKTIKRAIPIELNVPDMGMNIIRKYSPKFDSLNQDELVFPFFDSKTLQDSQKARNRKKDLIKQVNKGLKEICESIGIEKVTSYNARHSYATHIRDEGGQSIEIIQKMLGHASVRTTEIYLDSLTSPILDIHKQKIDEMMRSMCSATE